MRPRMFAAAQAGEAFALATIIAADGGPRPVGAQMVITQHDAWGFLSGGCIEADVALHGREVLSDGEPQTLVYGHGSPFIDMRLPCGGRIDVMVERVAADDPALRALAALTRSRQVAHWESDGRQRRCSDTAGGNMPLSRRYTPPQRLLVVGSDAFALAIATLGASTGWEVTLIAPFGPETPPPGNLRYDRRSADTAITALAPDAWTAIAVATHDIDADHAALVAALRSSAGYIGVLGAQRRIPERLGRLREEGMDEAAIERLKAPIGLPIHARAPWELAVSVVAEIVAQDR